MVALLGSAPNARAEWLTQSFNLKAGWNAIYLHVDVSHATLAELIDPVPGNPIEEIWLWNPPSSTLQFVDTPQQPTGGGSQWTSWIRSLGGSSSLQRLLGNTACLVLASNDYTWTVKGKAVPPRYEWTSSGLNFLGFPTIPLGPPSYENFLAKEPELQRNAEIFRYPGGPLGPGNPVRLFALRTTPVVRGEAVWIRSGDFFNRYFGPFEVVLQNPEGAHFRDFMGQYKLRLRNMANEPITVSLQLLASEAPPAGQTPIVQTPPLLVRGSLNPTNLTYGHSNLNGGTFSWALAAKGQPDAEVEIVLGVNRAQMVGNPGDYYAGVLRFTDSLGYSQVDVPVSAEVQSRAGLWIGDASVNEVRHYLKNYERDPQGTLVISSNGNYVAVGTNTTMGFAARAFPLRLIVHNDASDNAVLLQRVYYGPAPGSNVVLATREDLLHPGLLGSARRISSTHLPFSVANNPWPLFGQLSLGSNVTVTVNTGYDDHAANPFVHTYHPDHDNLNATFNQKVPEGQESYGLSRQIRLSFTSPLDDFLSLTTGGQILGGVYEETLTLLGKAGESRQYDVRGSFSLNRVSAIETLTTTP